MTTAIDQEDQLPSDLKRATKLAEIMVMQASRVMILTEELKAATASLLKTQRVDLPELMKEVGLTGLTMANGDRIEIKEDVQCGITEVKHDRAMQWLIDHNFGGIVKTSVQVEFDRGGVADAVALAAKLQEEGLPACAIEKVHAATLKAFIKEQLENGQDLPFDLFGIVPFSFAKLTRTK
jgi:hypothetical protein